MSNWNNYGNFFINFMHFCDIAEKNGLILFIFGAVINHNSELMHVKYTLALCQDVAFNNMPIISFCIFVVLSWR